MAAYQYWRLTGFLTDSNALELSQAQLYDGVQLIAQEPTFTVAPTTGTAFPDTLRWDDFSMPGFALTWDLVIPVANPKLRLGACTGADTFPKELYCQYSDDGKFWSTNNAPGNIDFPGVGLMTAAPGAVGVTGDPEFSKVSLLLQDSLTDKSSSQNALTVVGNTAMTAGAAPFAGGSSISFDGTGDGVVVPVGIAAPVPQEDFTFEAWIRPTTLSGVRAIAMRDASTNTDFQFLHTGGQVQLDVWSSIANFGGTIPGTPLLIVNTWVHVAFTVVAGLWRTFVGGVLQGSINIPTVSASSAPTLSIGNGRQNPDWGFVGHMNGVRITKGLARYTASFTPPTAAFPTSAGSSGGAVFIPLSETPQAKRWRLVGKEQERIAGSELPAHNLREVTAETSFMDAYHGGNGRLYGTVKEKHAPLDIPLRREVLLIDKASRLTIRVTWSDSITGDYEFIGIRMGVKYTVLAYDHFNIYRVVGADEQIPELML